MADDQRMSEEQPSGDGAWLRRLNTSRVLQSLYPHAIKSVTQIAQDLTLSRPTVVAAIKALRERYLVAELPPQHQDTGRPPAMYQFRRSAGYLLGVQVAPDVIRVLLTDLTGEVTPQPDDNTVEPPIPRQHERAVAEGASRTERLRTLEDAIVATLRSGGITPEQVWAVVTSTPGIVDSEGTVLVCGAIRDWTGDHLTTRLRRILPHPGCHIQVENDANLAAVAEHRARGNSRPANLVALLADHRLGVGIIAADAPHRGRGGRAGEIANQPISPMADASKWLKKRKDDNPAAIVRAAARGHAESQKDVTTFVEHLALGLATIVYTIDPDLIVIGGGLADAGSAIVDPLRERLDTLCRGREVPIEASTLGTQAVPLGALHLALDHAHHQMFTTTPR